MDQRQIQYFVCLYEEGSVTRAAQRLHIVQPALSMQIAKLEAELGQKLFDRSVQGMTLTSAGEALVRLTAPIVRDAEYARQEMAQLGGRISGRVSVGLITSVAQSTMASSSATVASRYPEITLSACEGYTETLVDWVNTGQLDFALINVPRRKTPLAAHHIMDEEMDLRTHRCILVGIAFLATSQASPCGAQQLWPVSFEFNVGADLAKNRHYVSGSVVARFGK